jgi:hypothetical protein
MNQYDRTILADKIILALRQAPGPINDKAGLIASLIPLDREETWSPLVRGTMPEKGEDEIRAMAEDACAKIPGTDFDNAMATIREALNDEVWLNDLYQVNVRRNDECVHLSIKRRDKNPVTDWRHKQQIKNQLVGPECEAVELYPAESRLVDTANQYHLWACSNPETRIPVGWFEARMISSESPDGGQQRPL